MSKSVTLRAKAMDPHKSLEEVFKAKLKENRSVSSMCQRVVSWDPADHWSWKQQNGVTRVGSYNGSHEFRQAQLGIYNVHGIYSV